MAITEKLKYLDSVFNLNVTAVPDWAVLYLEAEWLSQIDTTDAVQ